MCTAFTKYRTSVLAMGLGSLVAYGGGSPASNTTQVIDSTATLDQNAQIASLVKNLTTIMGHKQSSMDVLDPKVSRDSEKNAPVFMPALSFLSKNPIILPSRDGKGVTFDFSGCKGVSGSITVTIDSTPSHKNPHYTSKTTYDHFQYQEGSNAGSIDGTVTLVGTITPNSHTTSSFAIDLLSNGLKTTSIVGGVNQSWNGTVNLHLVGTRNGENSTQMKAWGAVRYHGSTATYGVTISPTLPLVWNTAQGTNPLSGTMNWMCGNTQIPTVFGPTDGAYTLNGMPQTLAGESLAEASFSQTRATMKYKTFDRTYRIWFCNNDDCFAPIIGDFKFSAGFNYAYQYSGGGKYYYKIQDIRASAKMQFNSNKDYNSVLPSVLVGDYFIYDGNGNRLGVYSLNKSTSYSPNPYPCSITQSGYKWVDGWVTSSTPNIRVDVCVLLSNRNRWKQAYGPGVFDRAWATWTLTPK